MLDLVIRNALIYDGSGNEAFSGNVGIQDGKIVAVTDELLETSGRDPIKWVKL